MRKLLILSAALLALFTFALCLSEEEGGAGDHVHDWTDYHTTVEPTCSSSGLQVRMCRLCSAYEELTLEPKDHDFSDWQYYTDDLHIRYCKVCGETETDSHDSAVSKVISTATETRLGKSNLTCAACKFNRTRFVSYLGRVYPTDTVDVVGDGTAYMKVNTVKLPQSSEKQLTLYSNGTFDIYASTDIEYEIYASAESGEYRGLKLTKGSAVLSVSGEGAELEFIVLSDGASLQIEFKDDAYTLSVSDSDRRLMYLRLDPMSDGKTRLSVIESALKNNSLDISLEAYMLSNVKLIYDDGAVNLAGEAPVLSAAWQYDAGTRELKSQTSSGKLSVLVNGEVALGGADSGVIGDDGWQGLYVSDDGAFELATATYNLDGLITALPAEYAAAVRPDDEGNKAGDDNEGGADVNTDETVISAQSEFQLTKGSSPKVALSCSDGLMNVRVSTVPAGYTLKRIEFIQTFGGLFRLVNAYTADASFEVESRNGRISVAVIIVDTKGNEKRVDVGEYEYRTY